MRISAEAFDLPRLCFEEFDAGQSKTVAVVLEGHIHDNKLLAGLRSGAMKLKMFLHAVDGHRGTVQAVGLSAGYCGEGFAEFRVINVIETDVLWLTRFVAKPLLSQKAKKAFKHSGISAAGRRS